MIQEKEAMEYEAGKTSLFMSFIYLLFPTYFKKVCSRRYKRYLDYYKNKNDVLNQRTIFCDLITKIYN